MYGSHLGKHQAVGGRDGVVVAGAGRPDPPAYPGPVAGGVGHHGRDRGDASDRRAASAARWAWVAPEKEVVQTLLPPSCAGRGLDIGRMQSSEFSAGSWVRNPYSQLNEPLRGARVVVLSAVHGRG